jgi:hypothetical protein
MKRIIIFLNLMLIAGFIFGQSQATPQGAFIQFDKTVYDYGTITQNDDGSCTFTFTNTGNEPLVLSSVRSSCGCTVPSWSREPILPGKSGEIKVVYDTRRLGSINKQVTVMSNATNPTIVLKIKGKVQAKPKEVMPVQNTSNTAFPVAN